MHRPHPLLHSTRRAGHGCRQRLAPPHGGDADAGRHDIQDIPRLLHGKRLRRRGRGALRTGRRLVRRHRQPAHRLAVPSRWFDGLLRTSAYDSPPGWARRNFRIRFRRMDAVCDAFPARLLHGGRGSRVARNDIHDARERGGHPVQIRPENRRIRRGGRPRPHGAGGLGRDGGGWTGRNPRSTGCTARSRSATPGGGFPNGLGAAARRPPRRTGPAPRRRSPTTRSSASRRGRCGQAKPLRTRRRTPTTRRTMSCRRPSRAAVSPCPSLPPTTFRAASSPRRTRGGS